MVENCQSCLNCTKQARPWLWEKAVFAEKMMSSEQLEPIISVLGNLM